MTKRSSADDPTVPPGQVVALLAQTMAKRDALFVANDDARAEHVAMLLRAAVPDACVVFLPSSDALPGDSSPATPGNIGRRVAALRLIRTNGGDRRLALVTSADAAVRLQRTPEAYDAVPPTVAIGDAIDPAALAEDLIALGYIEDERVDEPGEVAARGRVLDVFPADSLRPARVEVEDGKVVSIRRYDPVTQRTVEEVERLEAGQVREPDGAADTTVFAHLPDATILLDPGVEARRDQFVTLARDAAKAGARREPLVDKKRWTADLKDRDVASTTTAEPLPRFIERKRPLAALARFATPRLDDGARLVLAGSARDLRFLTPRVAKALKRDVTPADDWRGAMRVAKGKAAAVAVPLDAGWADDGAIVVAAADLIGSRAESVAGAPAAIDPLMGPAAEFRIGDVVVHEDHGLGVIDGIETIQTGSDAIAIRYAGDVRHLVPVAEADRIWRYGADADAVTLDKADGSTWAKRRTSIDQSIAESARALTDLARARAETKAPVLDPDTADYERFAATFPFTESADQARAIQAVRDDLAAGVPMDRLVVGDVGYGKTEVALRAAAIAALAGHQVVIAAPTTVLVRQHLETFRARFADTDLRVEGLSRLSIAAEKKAVKAGLADGSVAIVIGTGAVAAKGVTYKKLALVVIDEEQRFGAADKAKLRDLGGGANHLLSLSATPIPRTLATALVGLQQLSLIATPPARRQPIRTSIAAFDAPTVRSALKREAAREGQSFVVVPRIDDMAEMRRTLDKLVPELTILEAHGKMPADEIDAAMVAFARGEADVLLATNIIEAGLDVPRANTMIVWRADRFGLSQLHQLRGRVGRGARRGQVLLTTAPDATIAPATAKRLRTLEAFDRLGAGFAISARDLDLRGAGDLVGETQAGHMKLIGVELYQFLLAGALKTARGEEVERWTPDLSTGVAGRLPEAWIPEPELRITLHIRVARIEREDEVDALEDELEDRFGAIPDEAAALLTLARVRVAARALAIERIDAGPGGIALTPRRGFEADPSALRFEEKKGRWILAERIEDASERLARVRELLEELGD